jgi:hypothetical protein
VAAVETSFDFSFFWWLLLSVWELKLYNFTSFKKKEIPGSSRGIHLANIKACFKTSSQALSPWQCSSELPPCGAKGSFKSRLLISHGSN